MQFKEALEITKSLMDPLLQSQAHIGFRTIIVILGLALAAQAHAAEKIKVCARYETSSGWSKGYSVQANVLKGTELIRATNSLDYMSHATYVVISWDNDEASVIELDFPALSAVPMQGKDQRGRKWEVAKTDICYM